MPVKKELRFIKEREELLNKMLKILNINTVKNSFILYFLDKNNKIQEEIMKLKDDIKLYYSGSSCRGINKKDSKRPYMSIIRFILKENQYKLIPYDFSIKPEEENTPPIRTKRYQLINNK